MEAKNKYALGQLAMVVVLFIIALWIGLKGPGEAKDRLTLTIGYATMTLTFLYGMVVLVAIIFDKIDLKGLLSESGSESNKGASVSRFQLLIFTFVIGLSVFYMVVMNGKFPEISANVLALLGISASTYAVSKGIQHGSKQDGDGDGAAGGGGNGGGGGAAGAGGSAGGGDH
ncbi:MAG TPA: hypothetical protein VGV35_07425 [Bryobacteraceae bacterium]|nr:hypothetical protein [Bryobacteraceae bacterium]